MRNLKKFLALVLAMVMAFSLMLTASAANEQDNGTNQYGDATVSDTFKEAVDVLYGMGIMTGDNGNFYGNRDVMRSEMAAVMYRLVTGDTKQLKSPLYASIAAERFSDVKESDWFAPYIGFCYDLGLVKGHDGKYNPWGKVNGYETLIMALRAIGYGKNGEYEGDYWYINASSDGTLYGLLKDVDKTHYANTLSANTKREVVASIIFQAAQKPQVVYRLGNYDPFVGVPVGTGNNKYNLSLGEKNFGLTYGVGVIVGNQSTGEDTTRVNFDLSKSGGYREITDYCYDVAQDYKANEHNILDMKWPTDLRFFGHAAKVWYDYREDANEQFKTYALYDRATLTKVVKATGAVGLDDAGTNDLGKVVKAAGFTLNAATTAFQNYSFGPMQARGTDAYKSPILTLNATKAATEDAPYYLVISNSANKTADLVITLDLTVTQISQSNLVQDPNFVSVNAGNVAEYFGIAADRLGITDAYNQAKGKRLNILADSLGAASTTELGAPVLAVKVTGTTGANAGDTNGNFTNTESAPLSSDYYHELFKLTKTMVKTVIARNPKTEELTFNDGSTMKRSWLADTVADNRLLDLGVNAADNSEENYDRFHAPTVMGTYTFTVDENDEYIFWSTETSTKTFIYGTYLDYQQPVATSTFTYPLVGVIDGKMVTRNIINGTANNGNDMSNAEYEASELPKRDSYSAIGAQVEDGVYQGFYITEKGKVESVLAVNNGTSEWKQAAKGGDYFGANITINAKDVNVEAKAVGADGTTKTGLYLTNTSKIHVVSGSGTDTQEIKTFNGIKDFLGTSKDVTIKAGDTVGANKSPLKTGGDFADMIYWTQKTFNYAQDYTTTAWAVDEVYIPAEAISRTGTVSNSLYFIGDRTVSLLNNEGEDASQFTMYNAKGEKEFVWIAGLPTDAANTSATAKILGADSGDFFVNLVDTGDKANDNKPIYTLAEVSTTADDDNAGIVGLYVQDVEAAGNKMVLDEANDVGADAVFTYLASTYSQHIASIGSTRANLWNVEGATVVNLDTDTFPGVKDVATLNAASSIKNPIGANQGVKVSAVRNADNAQKLDVIFVNSDQT